MSRAPDSSPVLRRPERAAGYLALALGLLHLLFIPLSGTDLAAQLARADFARVSPFTPVDFSWYAGIHPFSYSLLAPGFIAVFGIAASGLICAVGSSVAFARLLRDRDRPWLAALFGAFFWTADVASGRLTFALGALAGLLALVLLPRRSVAASLAVLTALLSPVAAAFLGFVAAVLVLRRRPGGWSLGLSSTVPVVALVWLFPGGGVQPFSADLAVPGVLVGLGLAWLTSEPMVRTAAFLYAGAIVVFAVHEDPFGSNVLRLGWLVAASILLATTVRRPRLLVVLASFGMLFWQLDPLLDDLSGSNSPSLSAVSQELRFLGAFRVEVVAPRDHRESWELARDVPLARGWSRQLDVAANALFYRSSLTPAAYLDWLDAHAVDHVVVPRHGQLDFGSTAEAALIRGGVTGLTQEWSNRDWVIYGVPAPRPIASAPAVVRASQRTRLVLSSTGAGTSQVVLRWSRWLSLEGPGCLTRRGDHTAIRFARAGTVTVTSSLLPKGHC